MGKVAKVFMTGRSQAVRLPKEFRFKSNEVRIRKDGNAVILEPLGIIYLTPWRQVYNPRRSPVGLPSS